LHGAVDLVAHREGFRTVTCGARLLDLAWTAWRAGIIPE
jgi:hypothetical protein